MFPTLSTPPSLDYDSCFLQNLEGVENLFKTVITEPKESLKIIVCETCSKAVGHLISHERQHRKIRCRTKQRQIAKLDAMALTLMKAYGPQTLETIMLAQFKEYLKRLAEHHHIF